MSNATTELIKSHRSIRHFTEEPIPNDILHDILESAQWAPSSHNGQAYSVIVVRKRELKEQLSEICMSQRWVVTCPVFLVFCMDFYRLNTAADLHGADFRIAEVENVLVGTVDTALAAQNILLAARSHGLGGVMMGGIREDTDRAIELLNLPPLTFPLLGMCLGYPLYSQMQKPRLPFEMVFHEERYHTNGYITGFKEYDDIVSRYYTIRTEGKRTDGWSKQMADYFSEPQIPLLKSSLLRQGFKME